MGAEERAHGWGSAHEQWHQEQPSTDCALAGGLPDSPSGAREDALEQENLDETRGVDLAAYGRASVGNMDDTAPVRRTTLLVSGAADAGAGRLVTVDLSSASPLTVLERVQHAAARGLGAEGLGIALVDGRGNRIESNADLCKAIATNDGTPLQAVPSEAAVECVDRCADELQDLRNQAFLKDLAALTSRIDGVSQEVERERGARASLVTALGERLDAVQGLAQRAERTAAAAAGDGQGRGCLRQGGGVPPQAAEVAWPQATLATSRPEDHEAFLRAAFGDVAAVYETHREHFMKVAQGITELGKELTDRLERLEAEVQLLGKSYLAERLRVDKYGEAIGLQDRALGALSDRLREQGERLSAAIYAALQRFGESEATVFATVVERLGLLAERLPGVLAEKRLQTAEEVAAAVLGAVAPPGRGVGGGAAIGGGVGGGGGRGASGAGAAVRSVSPSSRRTTPRTATPRSGAGAPRLAAESPTRLHSPATIFAASMPTTPTTSVASPLNLLTERTMLGPAPPTRTVWHTAHGQARSSSGSRTPPPPAPATSSLRGGGGDAPIALRGSSASGAPGVPSRGLPRRNSPSSVSPGPLWRTVPRAAANACSVEAPPRCGSFGGSRMEYPAAGTTPASATGHCFARFSPQVSQAPTALAPALRPQQHATASPVGAASPGQPRQDLQALASGGGGSAAATPPPASVTAAGAAAVAAAAAAARPRPRPASTGGGGAAVRSRHNSDLMAMGAHSTVQAGPRQPAIAAGAALGRSNSAPPGPDGHKNFLQAKLPTGSRQVQQGTGRPHARAYGPTRRATAFTPRPVQGSGSLGQSPQA